MLCAAVSADLKARNAAMFGRTMPAKFAGGYARYFLGPPGGALRALRSISIKFYRSDGSSPQVPPQANGGFPETPLIKLRNIIAMTPPFTQFSFLLGALPNIS